MDLKKVGFPDHFASVKRKVVSGFGLGLVVSLIFLSVFVFNSSFKTPFFNPIFQGLNTFGSNSSSVTLSWPFSSSSAYSKIVNDTAVTHANGTVAKLPDSLKTPVANVSQVGLNGTFVSDSGKGGDLEGAHVGNSSDLVKDETFGGDGNVIVEKSIEGKVSGSLVGESVGLGDDLSSGNGSSSVSGGESVGSGEGLSSSNGTNLISGVGEISNLTHNGENGASLSSPEVMNPVTTSEKVNATISSNRSQSVEVKKTSLDKCDIFDGRWVRDDTKPYYPAGSCPHIDRDFDCYLNKRPDSEFVKWRWQPNGCDIPSLNATDFLERIRGKKLVFVGDSLNRNMWESLVCILRHSVKNKKRVYEISGKKEFKKKGFYAFRFEDYDCTVDFVSSPFLVRESYFKEKNVSLETLRLDLMDRTTSMYRDADYLIFNTGHWWTHEKTSKGENYYQEGNVVHTRLKVLDAYTRALNTWARWVDKNIDKERTQVFFRGYSVTHFRGGYWNTGGQCHQETEPIYEDVHLIKYPSKMRALEYVIQDMKTPVVYLNISKLTDYRKDAHPSIYRMEYKTQEEQIAAVHSQDCSHWCLPGVPDTWNELLYASLLKIGKGSWKI
ncbi:hypothetical protein DCAR_0207984 [Daucus carota subsp. sativus]|uniref:Uncharacterized protein n=1 Tax=Daucus carota subsp. sativus TaxID=79200 RepID=A0A162AUV9_DAUCS|nr:PREDICTED: protein trichome birefringence-like 2 [Daucus carota subsp. sativus]WOG88749.1 hypothetical protein DCAR_0207984 [Daucus carota subsp. sativus]